MRRRAPIVRDGFGMRSRLRCPMSSSWGPRSKFDSLRRRRRSLRAVAQFIRRSSSYRSATSSGRCWTWSRCRERFRFRSKVLQDLQEVEAVRTAADKMAAREAAEREAVHKPVAGVWGWRSIKTLVIRAEHELQCRVRCLVVAPGEPQTFLLTNVASAFLGASLKRNPRNEEMSNDNVGSCMP